VDFSFILNSLFTYGFGAFALTLLFYRWNKNGDFSTIELFIYGLGLGPAITTTILYYALLALPEQSNLLYVGLVALLYCAIAGSNWKYASLWFGAVCKIAGHMGNCLSAPFGEEGSHGIIEDFKRFVFSDRIFYLFMFVLVVYGFGFVMFLPVTDHDALIYASQGKIFYQDLSIGYGPLRFDEASAYQYIGMHGFGFPLQLTWERLWQGSIGGSGDFYFRSLNYYYLLLLLVLPYYWLRKLDIRCGLLAILLLFLTQVFMDKTIHYSLDTYRLFFVVVMTIFMLKTVNTGSWLAVIGFGVFSGLAANAHSFGMILFPVAAGAAFLFMQGNVLKERVPKIAAVGAICLLCGGLHYVIDVLWGTGWIFQEMKYF
jgi:hypothetical protein